MTAQSRIMVKFVHAALDDESGELVLRGVVDPSSLVNLKVADYQREILPLAKISKLADAFKNGSVPDIDLGMRGGGYVERDGAFYLQDDVYIIDGRQRRTAALESLKRGIVPRLGATVHFNTTETWERDRFRMLNTTQLRLSPNVLLRNMRLENLFVEMLYGLCSDRSFVLGGRTCWDQKMQREHLITAVTLLKSSAFLHAHLTAGVSDSKFSRVALAMERLMGSVGRQHVRNNIKAFWELVDVCWGIKQIHFKEGATYLNGNFLYSLSQVLAQHQNFWDDCDLHVSRDLSRKIGTFPINDPEVVRLSGSTGTAKQLLKIMLINHINSGKRTKRLVLFPMYASSADSCAVDLVAEERTA